MDAKIEFSRTGKLRVTEADEIQMYQIGMASDGDNAIEQAPAVLEQYNGIEFGEIDISAAKISTAEAISLETSYSGSWNGASGIIAAAAERVLLDHRIRMAGRKLTSKYAGRDAVTGAAIKIGDEIIWHSDLGTVIA